jgi:YesN/AraC family two-component response regulator
LTFTKTEALINELENPQFFQNELLNPLRQMLESKTLDEESGRTLFYDVWISLVHSANAGPKEISSKLMTFINDCTQCKSYDEILILFKSNILSLRDETNSRKLYSREIIQTINYIHSNFNKQITLKAISDDINLSPNYLSNLFKKELEVSLFEYLNRYRINKSMELLLTTNMKTYEVAYAVGYSDESYFSKTFKKYTGQRPNDYKKVNLRL